MVYLGDGMKGRSETLGSTMWIRRNGMKPMTSEARMRRM